VCDQSVKSHSREVDGLEGPIYDEFRDGQPRRRGLLNSVTAKTCGKVQIRVTGMGPYHTIRVETIVLVKASPRAFHLHTLECWDAVGQERPHSIVEKVEIYVQIVRFWFFFRFRRQPPNVRTSIPPKVHSSVVYHERRVNFRGVISLAVKSVHVALPATTTHQISLWSTEFTVTPFLDWQRRRQIIAPNSRQFRYIARLGPCCYHTMLKRNSFLFVIWQFNL
jgi:hypothetical protein